MCRFAAYIGNKEILLGELLANPKNSLIKQSHEAREGLTGVNADGFGMAWYNFDISNTPAIFKTTQPAWNDNNLAHLAEKIKSSCFLAHVRASTVGDVNQSNCHPFYYKEYALVHNGTIKCFDNYKKKIIEKMDEEFFLRIKGNTDSEHFFFLIMHFVKHNNTLENSIKMAINWVIEAQKDDDAFSRINTVLTSGDEIIATRFVSKDQKSLSLRYLTNLDNSNKVSSVIISSEALDEDDTGWEEIPENHYLYLNRKDMLVKIKSL